LITVCRFSAIASVCSVPLVVILFHPWNGWVGENEEEETWSNKDLYITIAHSVLAAGMHVMVAEFGKKELAAAVVDANSSNNERISFAHSSSPSPPPATVPNKKWVVPFHLFGLVCALLLPLSILLFDFVNMTPLFIQILLILSMGTIITIVASIMLYLDGRNTLHSLIDLESSKYHFKSL